MHSTIALMPVPGNATAPELTVHCAQCSLRKICLPMGLSGTEIQSLDRIVGHPRRVARGASLFRMNDPFHKIYAIRFGYFKTYQLNARGEQQITGFQMPGELLGLDAVGAEHHHCGASTLEDSEVCEIPFSQLEELFSEIPALLRHFHRLMAQEITREQNAMLLLATMRSDQRIAVFLSNLSARQAARGYSGACFQLRMMREEVGNYLGMTIESVCRQLSRFRKSGLVRVTKREVEILDPVGLRELACGVHHAARGW